MLQGPKKKHILPGSSSGNNSSAPASKRCRSYIPQARTGAASSDDPIYRGSAIKYPRRSFEPAVPLGPHQAIFIRTDEAASYLEQHNIDHRGQSIDIVDDDALLQHPPAMTQYTGGGNSSGCAPRTHAQRATTRYLQSCNMANASPFDECPQQDNYEALHFGRKQDPASPSKWRRLQPPQSRTTGCPAAVQLSLATRQHRRSATCTTDYRF